MYQSQPVTLQAATRTSETRDENMQVSGTKGNCHYSRMMRRSLVPGVGILNDGARPVPPAGLGRQTRTPPPGGT
ncbi:hypothetical protein E2C01_034105 [Portunus trituberculatus]|uniref:Uncharacterized protein n=1 Tax=Portunus trituberculatus TaxID=210409 RepID=A0A5B7F7M0_PORTR|nr:hypothetical protein [Portunus trituberculatus]